MPYKDEEKRRLYNKQYQRKHYARNKQYYKTKSAERAAGLTVWLRKYKVSQACSICGYKAHPAALDFHHLDSASKAFSVARGPTDGHGKKRLLAEIKKCIVVCSNCHRIIHAEQQEYYLGSSPGRGSITTKGQILNLTTLVAD